MELNIDKFISQYGFSYYYPILLQMDLIIKFFLQASLITTFNTAQKVFSSSVDNLTKINYIECFRSSWDKERFLFDLLK